MLKPFASLLDPDERFAQFVTLLPDGSLRKLTLEDHYACVARVTIGEAAPSDVRRMFVRAQHTLIYSWFDYELSAVAEMQAFATVELALRARLKPTRRTMLRQLVKQAAEEGLIPQRFGDFAIDEWFAEMRNRWAHGSTNFGSPGMTLTVMGACAEVIAGLYPPSLSEMG